MLLNWKSIIVCRSVFLTESIYYKLSFDIEYYFSMWKWSMHTQGYYIYLHNQISITPVHRVLPMGCQHWDHFNASKDTYIHVTVTD